MLNLLSTTLFADFLKVLTSKMMVSPVAIGYIPSFLPKSPKPLPKLLEDEESYYAMINESRISSQGAMQRIVEKVWSSHTIFKLSILVETQRKHHQR
jgi:hypothetical protein